MEAWLRDTAPLHPLRESCLLWTLMFTHYMAGDLQAVVRQFPRLRKAAASGGIDNFLAWADYLDGLLNLQRGDLETAIIMLEKAGERKYYHLARGAADALGALAVAYQANGQPDQATTTIRSLASFGWYLGGLFEELGNACAAQVALMEGRTEPAFDWLRGIQPPSTAGMVSWFIQPCVIRCRVLIAEGSAASLAEAEERLQEYAEMNEAHHNTVQLIGILNLLAIACERQDKRDEARSVLQRSRTLARPTGFIFPFIEHSPPMADLLKRLLKQNVAVDYVGMLLAAFRDVEAEPVPDALESESVTISSARPQPLVEPLTNRELDVLELLTQRLQNKEIADKLFISVETVKGHLKNIYQKLNVSKRRDAVEKGKKIGIL